MIGSTHVTRRQQNRSNLTFTCGVVINYHEFMQVQVERGTGGSPLRGFPPLVITVLVPVIFIALKLASVIDWSWGWVLAPIWIPALIAAVIGILGAVAFTLVKWLLMARAWLRFRQTMLPELALADPAILTQIEAERQRASTGAASNPKTTAARKPTGPTRGLSPRPGSRPRPRPCRAR
jgi:hypothetical protein